MPVVTFYLICDWHRMLSVSTAGTAAPPRDRARACLRDRSGRLRISAGPARRLLFSRPLLRDRTDAGGTNFGLLIGFAAGLLTFVPYIGSLTGLLVGTSVAIVQFWPDWKWIVAVVAIFLVGQFVEGNIVAPKLSASASGCTRYG